jgi:hypothetical protein
METKKTDKVVIERKIDSVAIGNEIASRVAGKPIDIPDVYCTKTGKFLTEDEMKKKGVNFVSISYKKDITKDLLKKNRQTKEKTTWEKVIKTMKIVILCEVKWAKFIAKLSTLSLEEIENIVKPFRSNGVVNYHCRTIGKTFRGATTINGIVFKTVEKTQYFDKDGLEIDRDVMVDYLPIKSYTSMHKKYAIPEDVKLPMYRTVRVDSCEWVKSFGFIFKPTDNEFN